MNILQILREFPKANEYLNFNETERHKWVATIASKLPAGTHILDVGAGPCRYKALFSHCVYKAHDFAKYTGVKQGNQNETWVFGELDYISDITSIPVPDQSFDAILCTEVLEHVPEPIKALQEMARILKPGAHIYISAPLGAGRHQSPYHFYGGYTPHFYEKFFEDFGIDLVEILPNGGLLRHVAQEDARASRHIIQERKLGRFSPARLILGLLFLRLIPIIFYHLDSSVFVEEFTVGYFVTGRKKQL